MARRSGGGGRRPAPRPAARSAPPPARQTQAPPPAPVQPSSGGSMLGGLGATIAQGMAFGTGSSIAHRAVDSLMGPRSVQVETVGSESAAAAAAAPMTNSYAGSNACDIHNKAFTDCLNNYGSDISKCQFYLDMLTECRRNSGSGLA